jgi:calpain
LENHYYGVIETREFHKEKLRLVRIRNVWGPEGGWNGAFCDDSEEWDKHRNLREELKHGGCPIMIGTCISIDFL